MTELETLLSELTCGDDLRAEAAAESLARLGAPALAPLTSLLHSGSVDERWWAVRALAGFPASEEVKGSLLAALQDDSEEVRQCSALALCHHPDPQNVQPLIRALSDPDAMTAKLASNALILLGTQATPALLDVLNSGSLTARLEAARAIAEIKDPRAIPALMKALESDSALVQIWAEHGLDKLGLGMVYLKPE